ncbi:MAG TPA: hypothetical protein VG734_17190, partial [Lacunisphaera sp.]|nr:hypothetical protein [Lacunisphaera sp.]
MFATGINFLGAKAIGRLLVSLVVAGWLAVTGTAAPGDLDISFGNAGVVTTAIGSGDDYANSMVVQSDGKIVVAGYTTNGS